MNKKCKWPGERDSNPRRCYPQRFSRPPLSTAQPSPDNKIKWRRHSDSNRGIKALQAHALPLGYVATYHLVVPGAGLEPARKQYPRDFKSLVSTIPPPGHCSINKQISKIQLNISQKYISYKKEAEKMERETGVEPAAPTLARLCSTTELFPQTYIKGVILSILLRKIKTKPKKLQNLLLFYHFIAKNNHQ